ncbi:MAG TPA: NADH-quinone oxidoreductase subunit C [Acidobacteriota bacterium]|nr:NADH-quinone oxidoreductase subunit C [Acidobacteriota bacterium]
MPDAAVDRPAAREALDRLSARFPGMVLAVSVDKGETVVRLGAKDVRPAIRFLKDELGFNALEDLIVLDDLLTAPAGGRRFTVLYQLFRFPAADRLRLAVEIGEDESLDSVVEVYRSADWAEREAFDMFGVRFVGHPGLRRIYMPDEFEGHPLRKDFPLRGRDGGV